MGWGYFRRLRPPGRLTPCQRAICALLACVAPAAASAQVVTETADAQAAILDNGAMANLADMDFGTMTQPAVASTVTMTPAVAATCSPSAGVVHAGACQPATFAIMGKKHDRARIRENNGGTILLTGPGGATMTVTNLTIGVTDMTPNGGAGGWNFGRWIIEPDSGIAQFRIGGRLNIGANQAPGVYVGTLNMQVQLN